MSIPLLEILGVGACVFVGALFATADAAVTALPEARLRALVDASQDGAGPTLRRIIDERDVILARFLVGRVACLVAAAVWAASLFRAYVWGPVIAGASCVLLYGATVEIAATLVRRRAGELAAILLRVVRPFEIAVLPLAAPLAWIGASIGRVDRFRRPTRDSDATESARIAEAEVEYLIEKGKQSGDLPHSELLQAAVEFQHVVASDVMVPRTHMVAIELKTPLLRVLERISAEGHSRYPIFDTKIDEIVGLLYVKDLFRLDRLGKLATTRLDQIARKPVLFVQEAQEVSTILKEMRGRRLHMAIVLDEFGGTAGLVTLEDILELLVGDIRDELDEEDSMQDLGDGRLLVDAAVPVEELSERLGVELPHHGSFVSVGGLVMEHLGKVPEPGTVIHVGDVSLTVRDADARRVRRIEVSRDKHP